MIPAQGQPDETMFTNIFPEFEYFFKMQGFSECHLIRACGVREAGEVEKQDHAMQLAEKLAQDLCNGHWKF